MRRLTAGRDVFVVQGPLHYTASAEPSERLPVFELPLADRRWFWGRQNLLDQLERAWRGQAPRVSIQALVGLGGAGKSQLAAQFAYRHRDLFEIVWWVPCGSVGSDLDSRGAIASHLGDLHSYLGLPMADTSEERAAAVRRWLEATGRRWLLIFDDAADWNVLQGMVPQAGNGMCLITSRNPHWDLADAVLPVPTFDAATGAAFLQARTGLTDSDGAFALSEQLGGLALALEQAGAFLAHSPVRMEFNDYLLALRDQGLQVLRGRPVDDYEHVVATVWEQSLLDVTSQSTAVDGLLALLGVLAPAPLPLEVLTKRPDGTRDFELTEALGILTRYALMSTASETLVVHQLVHRVIASRLTTEQASSARTQAIELLTAWFPEKAASFEEIAADTTTWPVAAMLVPHIVHLFSNGPSDLDIVPLVRQAASFLRNQGDDGSARHLQKSVLDLSRQRLGESHPDTLAVLTEFAWTVRSQGEETHARDLQAAVLDGYRCVLGDRHPRTIRAANDLGVMVRDHGELERARELQEEVLSTSREVLGRSHITTLAATHNLSVTLSQQGYAQRAREMQEELLDTWRALPGEYRLAYTETASELAHTLSSLGKLDEARQYHEEVLAITRELLGERHPSTLGSLTNLGLALWNQGRFAQARDVQEQALATFREVRGDRHPDTLSAAHNLALTLKRLGQGVRARELQEDVFAARLEVQGARHPDSLRAAATLAESLLSSGDRTRARQLLEETLAVCEELFGDRHPMILRTSSLLGITLRELGELERARELHEAVTAAYRESNGDDHPNTRRAESELRSTIRTQQRGEPRRLRRRRRTQG